MTRLSCTMLVLATAVVAYAQTPPVIEWQRNLGGSTNENAVSVEQTSDGGYILCGTTFSNNGDVAGNHGTSDIWVVKLDAQGNIQWQKCLGGSLEDDGKKAIEKQGGGYLVLGNTTSNNGDVSGNHGSGDIWVAELTGDGSILWQRCYGGSLAEGAADIEVTPDGGYLITGTARSSDGDLSTNAGGTDFWLLKINVSGAIQWQYTYGGSFNDDPFDMILPSIGGSMIVGVTNSNDGDVSGAHGLADVWVIKLDNSGALEWQRACGGSDTDFGISITEMVDGSFMATGNTLSSDGDVSSQLGNNDLWAIRLSALGQLIDERSYGGSNADFGNDVISTTEGGSVNCGGTRSSDGDLTLNQGMVDAWLFRTGANGDVLWSITLGGSQSESFLAFSATTDGGYIATGQSTSADGDLPGNNGGGDIWVVKFGPDPVGIQEPLNAAQVNLAPNPCTDRLRVSWPFDPANSNYWQIVDAEGKLADTGNLQNGISDVNTSGLKPGAYNLVLHSNGDFVSAPFVKE